MASEKLKYKDFINQAGIVSESQRTAWVLPWGIIGAFLLLIIIEFIANPVEQSLGKFMSWTHSVRPETGQGWELSQHGNKAKAAK